MEDNAEHGRRKGSNIIDKNDAGSNEREAKKIGIPTEAIAEGMNKLFKTLCDVPKSEIGFEGDDIDIESYIRNKTRGYDLGNIIADESRNMAFQLQNNFNIKRNL